MQFPPVPPEIKSIAHFLKVAEEHEARNIVVTYWSRMFAVERAIKMVQGNKSEAVTKLLVALMEWMEKTKKEHSSNEGISNSTTAHALLEEYALQLFTYGDAQDRALNFNKNTIKAFYTAGILMDILEQFGPLSEDIQSKRKYAKWKAAYIHNCLKVGDVPIPGAPDEHLNNVVHRADLEDDEDTTGTPEGDANNMFGNSGIPNVPPPEAPFITPQPSVAPSTPTSPYVPVVNPASSQPTIPASSSSSSASLSPEKVRKAQKYCKFAESALDYEDFKTAVDNLNKALHLIQTGEDL